MGDIFYLVIFVFGAAIGSFVNVVALRYNSGLSFTKGSSVCMSCGKQLKWYELIPIISFLALKARCSVCQSRFSLQYLLVEIASGVAAVWLYSNFQSILQFLILFLIFEILILIFLYDLRHKIIPDVFVVLFIFFSFLYSFFLIHNTLYVILLSAILIPLPFALIWLFSKGRLMGLGDAKFMIGMGVLLGLGAGISAVFISFWIGAAFALILFLYNKVMSRGYNIGMKSEIPFGPFLVIGTVLTLLFEFNFLSL